MSITVKDSKKRKGNTNEEVQNKVYYDVSIKYNPEEVDGMYGFYSKAETEIHLSSAIVEDPLNYDLAISKFKIDTECLPIMIPEMKMPTAIDTKCQTAATAYKIWIHYPVPDAKPVPAGNFTNGNAARKCYIRDPAGGQDAFIYKPDSIILDANDSLLYHKLYECRGPEAITIVPNCGCPSKYDAGITTGTKDHNLNFKTIRPSKQGLNADYCINTDPSYYIYDYQSFLDRINIAIEKLVTDTWIAKYKGKTNKDTCFDISPLMCIKPVIFKAEDGKITMYINKHFLDSQMMLRFSGNLYKYIGMGFKCKFFYSRLSKPIDNVEMENGSFFIDYNSFPFAGSPESENSYCGYKVIRTGANNIIGMDTYRRSTFPFTSDVTGTQDKLQKFVDTGDAYAQLGNLFAAEDSDQDLTYVIQKQQFSSLPNWNICKGIIISSSFMPIKSEFYPTAVNDGFLTHYNTEEYREAQEAFGKSGGEKGEEKATFNKQSMKIVDVYYPMSASAGDIRSCIIYDNTNIENGNKIDMQGGVDLDHFDVKIKWVDIYGNTYPLYLAPGCNVNIRFCLTRKKLKREDLIEGFSTIVELLAKIADAATTTSEEDKNHMFDVTLEPKRKRGKVELSGVLENGLIVKS